jgi:signal transduction histidine kinase
MQGYAQSVLEDYQSQLDETAVNYLQRIKNAAERLDKLIQDLLAYTRVSRENSPLVPVDLDALVREMLTQYPNFLPPAVDVAIEGSLPKVMGRESSLTQVMSNLLGNSVKFVKPGITPHVRIRAECKGDKVRIWVEDNGIGIAPENQDRAFRIFEQINNSKLYTGTGVGLAIVKRAVESLNGQVGVVSVLDKGSIFWFELDKGDK